MGIYSEYWLNPDRVMLPDCKDRYLYKLNSRNLKFGVFSQKTSGFLGLRTKFDRCYVFEEYHVDYEGPFKTACPTLLLVKAPDSLELVESFTTCSLCSASIEWSPLTKWFHTVDNSPLCGSGNPINRSNQLLKVWLEKMELKYLISL